VAHAVRAGRRHPEADIGRKRALSGLRGSRMTDIALTLRMSWRNKRSISPAASSIRYAGHDLPSAA